MSKAYDFRAWLETKNPDETYNFHDGCGNCCMGQYMTHKGETWNLSLYADYVVNILGQGNTFVLRNEPQTFGGALERVRKLEDA